MRRARIVGIKSPGSFSLFYPTASKRNFKLIFTTDEKKPKIPLAHGSLHFAKSQITRKNPEMDHLFNLVITLNNN